MGEKELHRSMSIFSVGTVMKLADSSARQARYYEEQGLVHPERSEGNQHTYPLNDIDMLLETKDYLSGGLNMAGAKRVYEMAQAKKQEAKNKKPLTDHNVRQIFRGEVLARGGLSKAGHYQSQGLQRQFLD